MTNFLITWLITALSLYIISRLRFGIEIENGARRSWLRSCWAC